MPTLLGPETIVQLEGGSGRSRLSYVFKDGSGCRVGLTSAWILPFPSKAAARPVVFSDGERLGLVNPPIDGSGDDESYVDPFNVPVFSAGWLTCCFEIESGPAIDDRFMHEENQPPAISLWQAGVVARTLTGDVVGTMGDNLDHMDWHGRVFYPLRRLKRSDADRAKPGKELRSGSMVTTDEGALVGVIVSISRDRTSYAVAPILDVLTTHDLTYLTRDLPSEPPEPLRAEWRTNRVTPKGGRDVLDLLEGRRI